MSPTTKVLVCVVGAQIVKIAILKSIGHIGLRQLAKENPNLARYYQR